MAINDANANPLVGRLREEIRKLKAMVEANETIIAEHEVKHVKSQPTHAVIGATYHILANPLYF